MSSATSRSICDGDVCCCAGGSSCGDDDDDNDSVAVAGSIINRIGEVLGRGCCCCCCISEAAVLLLDEPRGVRCGYWGPWWRWSLKCGSALDGPPGGGDVRMSIEPLAADPAAATVGTAGVRRFGRVDMQ